MYVFVVLLPYLLVALLSVTLLYGIIIVLIVNAIICVEMPLFIYQPTSGITTDTNGGNCLQAPAQRAASLQGLAQWPTYKIKIVFRPLSGLHIDLFMPIHNKRSINFYHSDKLFKNPVPVQMVGWGREYHALQPTNQPGFICPGVMMAWTFWLRIQVIILTATQFTLVHSCWYIHSFLWCSVYSVIKVSRDKVFAWMNAIGMVVTALPVAITTQLAF